MTLKGILLGALIGAMLTAIIAALVMHKQDATWLLREQELVEDSARWQHLSGQHGDQARAASKRANDAERVAVAAIAERDAARKKRRARKPPADLETCLEENEEFRASEVIADRAITFLEISNAEKDTALDEKDQQIIALTNVASAERERGDGWKKQSKRGKAKIVFGYIGAAGAGALVGAGAMAAAQ